MKKYLILIAMAVAVAVCSCNGASTQAANTNTNNNGHLIDPAADGNGVWNYSVATDYFYGESNESPSLKYDLAQYTQTDVEYVFPVFGYLTANGSTSSYSISCSPSSPVDFNYYANPQVKEAAVTGVSAYLGNCVNGESVTAYYSGFINHVVPTVEYDGSFLAPLTTLQVTMLTQIADTIASVINNDPNAYGVAFDNEPSINSQASTSVVGLANEAAFFGEIAFKLAESKKYLFLFDANATGISLYKTGYNGYNLNNIVLLQPLYDLESTGNYPSGPVNVESYLGDAYSQAVSDLSDPASPPILYVLPASATSTIWNYLQGYNMVSSTKTYTNPTTLSNPAACQSSNAATLGTIDNSVLSLLLCSSTNVCPPTSTPSSNITQFLDTNNCVNYSNSNVVSDYFTPVLQVVESAATHNGVVNSRYLGSSLYAWRISAMSDIGCGINYFSVEGNTASKTCTQVFPTEISPIAWTSFNNWGWPN